MVQNIINLGEKEDRILNIIKAKFGFKNKSQAVEFLARNYEEKHLEEKLKPEKTEAKIAAQVAEHPNGHYIG